MFAEQTVPTASILVKWKKFEPEHCLFLFVQFPATNKSLSECRFASRRKKLHKNIVKISKISSFFMFPCASWWLPWRFQWFSELFLWFSISNFVKSVFDIFNVKVIFLSPRRAYTYHLADCSIYRLFYELNLECFPNITGWATEIRLRKILRDTPTEKGTYVTHSR